MNPTTSPNPYSGYQDLSQGPSNSSAINPLFARNSNPITPATASANAPKESGNFWSTVGGIALPVLGALLAPETGGLSLLGGLAAGTALSGVGGVVGKAVDNSVAGQDPFQANNIAAGLTDAAGNLVGGGIGKVAGAILPKASKVLSGTADNLLMGQAPKGMLDSATADTLRNNFGITNLQKSAPTIDAITGQNGALNQGVQRGLIEAGDNGQVADLSNLNSTAKNLVSQYQTQLKPSSIDQVNRVLQGSHINAVNPEDITSVPVRGGGIINTPTNGALKNVLPQDAQAVTKNLETLASQAYNSAFDKMGNVIDTDQLAKYKIFSGLAKEAENQTFGGELPIALSEVNKAQILKELEPLKVSNPQAYSHLSTQLENTTNLNDLRSLQSPLVAASKALNASQKIADKSGGKGLTDVLPMGAGAGGFALGGPAGGIGGYALGKLAESQPASAAATSVLGKLSKATGSKTANDLVNTLGRISGVTAAQAPFMGAAPVEGNGVSMSTLNQPATTGGSIVSQPAVQPDQLNQILSAMEAQSVLAPSLNPASTSLLSSFAPQLQKNALLKNAVSALGSEYNNAGGAQGLGGIGSVISGFVPGTAANAYNGEVSSLSAQLAAALGISPEAAQNLLPGLLQNSQTAGQRQSVLGGLVGGLPS